MVAIYALLVCKIFGRIVRSCKFLDKSQVCIFHITNCTHLYSYDVHTFVLEHSQPRRRSLGNKSPCHESIMAAAAS